MRKLETDEKQKMDKFRFVYPAFLKIVRYELDNWIQQKRRINQSIILFKRSYKSTLYK